MENNRGNEQTSKRTNSMDTETSVAGELGTIKTLIQEQLESKEKELTAAKAEIQRLRTNLRDIQDKLESKDRELNEIKDEREKLINDLKSRGNELHATADTLKDIQRKLKSNEEELKAIKGIMTAVGVAMPVVAGVLGILFSYFFK